MDPPRDPVVPVHYPRSFPVGTSVHPLPPAGAPEKPHQSWGLFSPSEYSVKATQSTSKPSGPPLYETFAVDFVRSERKSTSVIRRSELPESAIPSPPVLVGCKWGLGVPSVFLMNWALPLADPPNPLWGTGETDGEGFNILIYTRLSAAARAPLEAAEKAGFDLSFWASTYNLTPAELSAAAAAEAAAFYPPLPEPCSPDSLASAFGSLFSWGGPSAEEKAAAARTKATHEAWQQRSEARTAKRAEYEAAYLARAALQPPVPIPAALAGLHRVYHGIRSVNNPRNRARNLLRIPKTTKKGDTSESTYPDGPSAAADVGFQLLFPSSSAVGAPAPTTTEATAAADAAAAAEAAEAAALPPLRDSNGVEVPPPAADASPDDAAAARAARIAAAEARAEAEAAVEAAENAWACGKLRITTRICNVQECPFNAVIKPLAEKYSGLPYFVSECTSFTRHGGALEMGIDVFLFSYLSKLGLAASRDILDIMVFDVVLSVAGERPAELPESMLLGVRLHRLSLANSPNITTDLERELGSPTSPTM